MTKRELIKRIALEAKINLRQAEIAYNLVLDSLKGELVVKRPVKARAGGSSAVSILTKGGRNVGKANLTGVAKKVASNIKPVKVKVKASASTEYKKKKGKGKGTDDTGPRRS